MKCVVNHCMNHIDDSILCKYHNSLFSKSVKTDFNEWLEQCNRRLEKKMKDYNELINR